MLLLLMKIQRLEFLLFLFAMMEGFKFGYTKTAEKMLPMFRGESEWALRELGALPNPGVAPTIGSTKRHNYAQGAAARQRLFSFDLKPFINGRAVYKNRCIRLAFVLSTYNTIICFICLRDVQGMDQYACSTPLCGRVSTTASHQ